MFLKKRKLNADHEVSVAVTHRTRDHKVSSWWRNRCFGDFVFGRHKIGVI